MGRRDRHQRPVFAVEPQAERVIQCRHDHRQAGVSIAPLGLPVCRRCKGSPPSPLRRKSGVMTGAAGASRASNGFRSAAASPTAILWVRVGTMAASGMRSARLPSKNSTLAPLSCTLKAISGICSRVFSGHDRRSGAHRTEQRERKLRPIAQQQRDTVTRDDTARYQAGGHRIHRPVELGIGDPTLAVDQRLAVRLGRHRPRAGSHRRLSRAR